MTLEKTFEVEKNGYRMFMVEDNESNYKSLDINSPQTLPALYLGKPSQMHSILKNNSFEELDIEIGTYSIGTQSVESIKDMVQEYELAIETVEYFKAELIKNFSK